MLDAQNRHAISAKITASGREPPAKATPAGIEAAMAAPGAMSVMLWNRTSRSPIAFRRRPVVVLVCSAVATAASLFRTRPRVITAGMVSRQAAKKPGPTRATRCGSGRVLWFGRSGGVGVGSAGTAVAVGAEAPVAVAGQGDVGGHVSAKPHAVPVGEAHVAARQHPVTVDEGAVGRVLVPDGRLAGVADGDRGMPAGHVLVGGEGGRDQGFTGVPAEHKRRPGGHEIGR